MRTSNILHEQIIIKSSIALILLLAATLCYGQAPVNWRFAAAPATGYEAILVITAELAPGWHLYSQRIKEGGPVPTKFRFEPGDDYMLAGITEEKGNADTFHDDIFEMEITWYAGTVQFSQRVSLIKPSATIHGKVEYMACNNEICIPAEQGFTIEVSP